MKGKVPVSPFSRVSGWMARGKRKETNHAPDVSEEKESGMTASARETKARD
jgi:hypothetical protein